MTLRNKIEDGRAVAKLLKANQNLNDKAIDAVWDIINEKNDNLYWVLRELYVIADDTLIENPCKEIRSYIEEYLLDNFSERPQALKALQDNK